MADLVMIFCSGFQLFQAESVGMVIICSYQGVDHIPMFGPTLLIHQFNGP